MSNIKCKFRAAAGTTQLESRARVITTVLRIGKLNQDRLTHCRLPLMTVLPTRDDLQLILSRAQRNWRASVEQPFKYPASDVSFILTVKCEAGSGEPCWMLYRTDESGSELVWSFISADLHQIRDLLHTECAAKARTNQGDSESPPGEPAADTELSPAAPAVAQAPPAAQFADDGGPELAHDLLPLDANQVLEGSLSSRQTVPLLQSISRAKLSGRLEFKRAGETGDIYFEEGIPTHASTFQSTGDNAALELLTWQEGSFHFFHGEKFIHRTINKSLELLVKDGEALLEQWLFLSGVGVHPESALVRTRPDIPDEDFTLTLLDRAGCDLGNIKAFYERIDDWSTLAQVLAGHPLPRAEWVPILFYLVSRNLVTAVARSAAQRPNLPEPIQIDQSAIDGVLRSLSRSETGLMSYAALLYLLKQEYFRFKRGGQPFALVVFSMGTIDARHPEGMRLLPIQSVRELGSRIRATLRELDIVAHFETAEFAMLLPHTEPEGAAALVRRLERLISGDPLMNTIHSHQIIAHFGIAAIPQDCDDPGILLAAAKEAADLARKHNQLLVSFRTRNCVPAYASLTNV